MPGALSPRPASAWTGQPWRAGEGAAAQAMAAIDRAVRASDRALAAELVTAAIALDPGFRHVRRDLAVMAARQGESETAWRLWSDELATDDSAVAWAEAEIDGAMRRSEFALLTALGRLLVRCRWGSRWFPPYAPDAAAPAPRVPRDEISVTKLRHDAGQFSYLRRRGILGDEFDAIVRDYEGLADRLEARGGAEARMPLDGPEREMIGHVYNRIVHLADGPRVARALSPAWDAAEVETRFIEERAGIVVIDDFLTPEALEGIRGFAMESTVWSGIRYAYGRLGAFFNDGFNCPLLLQIADELKQALPRVITERYPLRQVWGFKNSTELPPDSNLHADFAAVNVNFWITPDASNLDRETGGMIVYDVDAPLAWDFHTYNGRTDIIKAFLRECGARPTYIPYRQNRCVIFNADLFHGTHQVRFRPGFENHRINVTLLYGQREDDALHRSFSARGDLEAAWSLNGNGWRSFAFARHRR